MPAVTGNLFWRCEIEAHDNIPVTLSDEAGVSVQETVCCDTNLKLVPFQSFFRNIWFS
jgi:hypothetical protein